MKINVYYFKIKLYKYRKVLLVKLRFKPVIQLVFKGILISLFLNQFHIILVEKPVILEQVLLLQFCCMTSSRDVVPKGQELVFSLEFLVVGRT